MTIANDNGEHEEADQEEEHSDARNNNLTTTMMEEVPTEDAAPEQSVYSYTNELLADEADQYMVLWIITLTFNVATIFKLATLKYH